MIIDASVAVDWIVDSAVSNAARDVKAEHDLVAPDLLLSEVGNALWKHTLQGGIDADKAALALNELHNAFDEIVPSASLVSQAYRIAVVHNHPVYDCFYLALASSRSEPIATADKRMAALARRLSIEVYWIEPA